MIRQLTIKNYREFYSDLQKRLRISEKKEDEIYNLIEDKYNSIEDDNDALYKTFEFIEDSLTLNFTEKLYASMLLVLCDLKTQNERKKVMDRNFKNKFEDDEEIETINDGDDDD